MTGPAASGLDTDGAETSPDSPDRDPDAGPRGLRARAVEARARLVPDRPQIPAPRTPGGVTPSTALGTGPDAPAADLRAAADRLVADLATVEDTPDVPAHRALVRIDELVTTAIPSWGWSAAEGFAVDDLVQAAARAGVLHAAAVALLERLDAEDRGDSAAEVDALATALRVVRVVADLEVVARS